MAKPGFKSVSISDEDYERAERIAPHLPRRPMDGRRKDSVATAVSEALRWYERHLEAHPETLDLNLWS